MAQLTVAAGGAPRLAITQLSSSWASVMLTRGRHAVVYKQRLGTAWRVPTLFSWQDYQPCSHVAHPARTASELAVFGGEGHISRDSVVALRLPCPSVQLAILILRWSV